MITQTHIDVLRQQVGRRVDHSVEVEPAVAIDAAAFQMGLFDERNLFEFTSPEYPGERLIACKNPQLATRRAHKREALLEATATQLALIKGRVAAERLEGPRSDRGRGGQTDQSLQGRQAL